MDIHKHHSRSYPESLSDSRAREHYDRESSLHEELAEHQITLNKYREKDHDRTEQLARIGSTSSIHMTRERPCCHLFIRWGNYILERGEHERKIDQSIQEKSYAGFYYFIKWFVRSIFFMIFTTLGSIGGKELGCVIKDHNTCSITAVDLAGESPHVISTIFGFICGLILGQWIGRFLWDMLTKNVLKCLRRMEKCADHSKMFLITTSIFVYLLGTGSFGVIFYFFVQIGSDDDNILGSIVGGTIGLVCAIFAYRKKSTCTSGQETPMLTFSRQTPDIDIVETI